MGSMPRVRRSLVLAAAMSMALGVLPASAHDESPVDGGDGHADKDEQHGTPGGHLEASSKDVTLVGRLDLTSIPGGIADVAAFGDHAYLNTFAPECINRGGTGTGVHVVDVRDPKNPRKVNFLPAERNSYPGEGVHVFEFEGRSILVHNNENCATPVTSGFAVWDVTDPVNAFKVGQYGDALPAVAGQTFHSTHSVQGFVWQGRAYAVAVDNNELKDVDIFDLTPALRGTGPAVLVSERGLEDWPGAQGRYANGDSVFHHDMQQKVIDGRNLLLVSYWDAGQVLLDISDPANPLYVTDSDFSSPDPESGFAVPEGNSHQSQWSSDGRFVLSSDEDFSPTRTLCEVTSGPAAGATGCGEFGWTVPLSTRFGSRIEGRTVYGGSGCLEDVNGNGVSDRDEVPPASVTGATIVVFTRGTCVFSRKVESGELAGYEAVAIANSHGGSRNGLLPDSFVCGSLGHAYTPKIHAVCLGHRAGHTLFGSAPRYVGADAGPGGDMPAIGTLGASLRATGGVFDGWGYVHLHDATKPGLPVIDTYAVPEAMDPAFASGFGNLTVHEVKTDPRAGSRMSYASWYDAGLRVLKFGPGGIQEVGHFIAEGGNDFWGVAPLLQGQANLNDRDRGRGREDGKRPLLLMSDRDSGLWILRYSGKE